MARDGTPISGRPTKAGSRAIIVRFSVGSASPPRRLRDMMPNPTCCAVGKEHRGSNFELVSAQRS